jgi:hypothetical protein
MSTTGHSNNSNNKSSVKYFTIYVPSQQLQGQLQIQQKNVGVASKI